MKRVLLGVVALLMVAVLLELTYCMVPNTMGGYAAQCRLQAVDGWQGESNDATYTRQLPQGRFSLITRHLYYSKELVTLVEFQGMVVPDKEGRPDPVTLFDPATAWLVVNGKTVHAEPWLRENPFMQDHWTSGGVVAVPADLDKVVAVVMTFSTRIPHGDGFVLHLGQVVVDGKPVAIPDIPYCYLPSKTTWAPFHG